MTQRLNIGAGGVTLPGYHNIDRKTGDEAWPLSSPVNHWDEIRASHILEHFSHAQIGGVLRDWFDKLKPGGVLKIAVPDFELIAHAYLQGVDAPLQGYIMGGQTDADDYHMSVFDTETLTEAMKAAGLIGISRWQDNAGDCSDLDVSLNLMGIKPGGPKLGNIAAVMSVPRLGFQDNFFCAMGVLPKYGISLAKTTGAFWGQCLTRAIEEGIAGGADWIMTLDYDSVFTDEHIELLLSLAQRYPDADAIAPLQSHRSEPTPLMTIKGDDGKPTRKADAETFSPELTRVNTAHFGLTLIRVKSLLALPRPWFVAVPDSDGRWEDGKVDDDVNFWKQWEAQGLSLYQANRVAIGHLELMVRWPGRDFAPIHQHPSEFWKQGKPDGVWR